jgi:hypothetical protein
MRAVPKGKRHGLLRALFLDGRIDETIYFAGYLYIKAIAALFARQHPIFRDPGTLLPLLIRIICDHPIFERATTHTLTATDIVAQLHAMLLSVVSSGYKQIAQMLEVPLVREQFDNWDIYTTLQTATGVPAFHGVNNRSPLWKDKLGDPWMSRFRSATSVHLPSWVCDDIVNFDDHKLTLRTIDGDRNLSMPRLAPAYVNSGLSSSIYLKTFDYLQTLFRTQIQQAFEQRKAITIANYMLLTSIRK